MSEARRAGCTGKMVFVSRPEARDWARKTERTAGRPQTIYRCSWCGYWHLTTMPRGVAKKARLVVRAQVREARRVRRENPLDEWGGEF